MDKDITVVFGVGLDAVAGWLGGPGCGPATMADIQRGLYAGEVGVPRLLKLFERNGVTGTWFMPGHSLETFPDQCRMVVDQGHEVAVHGYSHETPAALTPVQEDAVLARSVELVAHLTGQAPRGYAAPGHEPSPYTADLLANYGFEYDHSQQHRDFVPYYARTDESWASVDYSAHPAGWMVPLRRGRELNLVEVGVNWYLDDLPPMLYAKGYGGRLGFVSPRVVEDMWKQQFEWVYRELDYAVFPLTIHPSVAGRPQCLMMLSRLIAYLKTFDGVRFGTMAEVAKAFRTRFPFDQPDRPHGV
ncbi:MAG: polysaccharide deacetylase [Bifidobacteriaceae bacterium]|nr:polysaccharide deacetylase [Bifidobacteriaceae bacterium]